MTSTSTKTLLIAGFLACVSLAGAARGANIAQYNLGENDGGLAIAGSPGTDPTKDAIGTNHLKKLGNPLYSSDTLGGGSTLSMNYDGNGDYYYGAAPVTDVTQEISYAFDAKMAAPGANGFSFLASLGSNFGGIAVVEVGGKISIFFPGAGGSTGEYTPDQAWHRYQVDYLYNGGAGAEVTTLKVDGNVVSTRNGPPANGQIINALTLGGNFRLNDAALASTRSASDFEGSFNGLIDNFVFSAVVPEPASTGFVLLAGLGFAVRVRRGCRIYT